MKQATTAFGDDGAPIISVDPAEPWSERMDEASDRQAGAEAVAGFLRWAVEGGSAVDVSRRVLVLAALCRVQGAPRNTRELGRVLGVSHVTAGRMLTRLRAESRGFLDGFAR